MQQTPSSITMKEKTIHIASCSFGKDSLATILLALEHEEPLDRVVYAEVMFDKEKGISGEMPEVTEWIHGTAIPRLNSYGINVDVVTSKNDYKDMMFMRKKSDNSYYGHQYHNPCYANGHLKIGPIKKYISQFRKEYNIIQYIGIASDETKRLQRLKGNKISLLAKYRLTQSDAMDLCRKYDLINPCYSNGCRGGCFFCCNAPIERYRHMKQHHPEIWKMFEDAYIATNSKAMSYSKTLTDIEKLITHI